MAYDIEGQRRVITDFLVGLVDPADIQLRPGLDFDAQFVRYPEGLRAFVSYIPFDFDDARHSRFAVVDDTLIMRATSKAMRGRSDLLYVLDGIGRVGAWCGRRRLYAAHAPDGSLVVSQRAETARDRTRPRTARPEPDEIDEGEHVRTAEDDIDDAAIGMGI